MLDQLISRRCLCYHAGATTRFIRQHAPNAIVFATDQWINEALLHDPEYSDEEVQRVLKAGSIHDVFLKNLWDERLINDNEGDSDTRGGGIVPLRIHATEALRWLQAVKKTICFAICAKMGSKRPLASDALPRLPLFK